MRKSDHIKSLNTNTDVFNISVWLPSVLYVIICLVLSITSCITPAYINEVPPMLPASYYQCIYSSTQELEASYFGLYANQQTAEQKYKDSVLVFKYVEILRGMTTNKGSGYLWVSKVKCVAANPADITKLQIGQLVDIVGVMRGISKDPGPEFSLVMTECYFLPAGLLAVPLPKGSAFGPAY